MLLLLILSKLLFFQVGTQLENNCLNTGKKSIAINVKHPKGSKLVAQLASTADVLLEPFRHGVMERLNLGPDVLLKRNPRLIYARLTGFGQKGPYRNRAGHDINYTALSGLLSLFGRYGEKPIFPANITADFGGGGLMCALGIVMALFEREKSGLGQIVDCSMVRGAAYLGSWLYRSQNMPFVWGNERGKNMLDSGVHFYEVYETKDGKFMSVGPIEPQFYSELLVGLELSPEEAPQLGNFEEGKELFASIFKTKTMEEWCRIFDKLDACVEPVLELKEAAQNVHNVAEETFVMNYEGLDVPTPQPVLSRTPGISKSVEAPCKKGKHTKEIMLNLNYTEREIAEMETEGIVEIFRASKL